MVHTKWENKKKQYGLGQNFDTVFFFFLKNFDVFIQITIENETNENV